MNRHLYEPFPHLLYTNSAESLYLFGPRHLYEPCFYSDKYGTQITPRLLIHLQVPETAGVALLDNHTICVIGGSSDGEGLEAHLASSISRIEIGTILPYFVIVFPPKILFYMLVIVVANCKHLNYLTYVIDMIGQP